MIKVKATLKPKDRTITIWTSAKGLKLIQETIKLEYETNIKSRKTT